MNRAIIAGNAPYLLMALLLSTVLTACGLTQNVSDGAVAVTKSLFYKQVKTLRLDIRAREAVNNNTQGAALSTVVRIYQLKDRKAFDGLDYPGLLAGDNQAIAADLTAQKNIRIGPGASVSVDMPMESGARFVAVAALFLMPDTAKNTWRVVLAREDLDPDTPRLIELNAQQLTLLPAKE